MSDLFAKLGRKANRWKRLSWSERKLLIQALLMLPLTVFGLKILGFQRVQNLLKNRKPTPLAAGDRFNHDALEKCRDISNMVNTAARYSPVFPKCLPKSLVLWWLLGREGIMSDLRIGTLKEGDRFEAHAWVEYRGTVINDSQLVHERYAVFDTTISKIGKV